MKWRVEGRRGSGVGIRGGKKEGRVWVFLLGFKF